MLGQVSMAAGIKSLLEWLPMLGQGIVAQDWPPTIPPVCPMAGLDARRAGLGNEHTHTMAVFLEDSRKSLASVISGLEGRRAASMIGKARDPSQCSVEASNVRSQ